MKADTHPQYDEIACSLQLRQQVQDPFHPGQGPARRSLLRVPPVLHRHAKDRGYCRPRREIPPEVRQAGRKSCRLRICTGEIMPRAAPKRQHTLPFCFSPDGIALHARRPILVASSMRNKNQRRNVSKSCRQRNTHHASKSRLAGGAVRDLAADRHHRPRPVEAGRSLQLRPHLPHPAKRRLAGAHPRGRALHGQAAAVLHHRRAVRQAVLPHPAAA